MNNSAAKVGEIFTEAGAAFNRLAELTMMLHPMAEATQSPQTKTPVKRKIAEDKHLVTTTTSTAAHQQQLQQSNVHITPPSHQVTLNMLNARESEMDAETLNSDVKLEFETEEVVS